MKYKAVIFDMDGVLVDSERFYYERRLKFFVDKKIDISHLPKNFFIGGKMRDLWPEILGARKDEFDIEALQKEYLIFRKNIPMSYQDILFPDVREILRFLKDKGCKLVLASSSDHSQINKLFQDTAIGKYFDLICSGEDFKEAKPNPEIYFSALEKLDLPAEKCLIIEDSTVGIQAGKAAGVEVWAVRDHYFGIDQSQADKIFDNLHEMALALADDD